MAGPIVASVRAGVVALLVTQIMGVTALGAGMPRADAVVDPEITRREVISRVASGEYKNVSFIHEIADSSVEDITADILSEAALPEIATIKADLPAADLDHARDLRKHETV